MRGYNVLTVRSTSIENDALLKVLFDGHHKRTNALTPSSTLSRVPLSSPRGDKEKTSLASLFDTESSRGPNSRPPSPSPSASASLSNSSPTFVVANDEELIESMLQCTTPRKREKSAVDKRLSRVVGYSDREDDDEEEEMGY